MHYNRYFISGVIYWLNGKIETIIHRDIKKGVDSIINFLDQNTRITYL